MIENELRQPSEMLLNMNNVTITCTNLLKENRQNGIKSNYKPYLKKLITDSISNTRLLKTIRKNGPEIICCKKLADEAVENAMKNNSDDINIAFKAAAIIRKELLI